MSSEIKTLRDYVGGYYGPFYGKTFQGDHSATYEIFECWQNIKTRSICAHIKECDIDTYSRVSTFEKSFSESDRLFDMDELTEGVNAERINPWAIHSSAI